jgi:DNA-binding winged helix-turn-helix (wHTH) protein/tetratricopeptide (TPR) repeat protein
VARGNRVLLSESSKRAVYRFGPFQLDATSTTLARNGNQLKLQDLPYRLLVVLVERPGEIVSREEVRQRLWPKNTFVEFDNNLGVAIRKIRDALGDNADAPCYVETVPRRGYRFLAPVTTATEPEDLLRSATGEAARPQSSLPGVGKRPVISGRRLRYIALAAFIVLVISGVAYRFRLLHPRTETQAAAETNLPPVHVRRSVAVMGFRNLPGRPEDNWLSSAFCEMLNTELAADGKLRMVSGEDVARAKSELPLRDEDSLGKSTLQRLRINEGADVVVVGSYTMLPNARKHRIRLDVRLQDTASGETIAEEAVSGDENDLFDLVADLGGKLRQRLGAAPLSEEGAVATRAALPSNEKAARLYAEGRARLWAFDYFGARDLLNKAIVADPDFPLTHAALSEVWWHTGYDAKARVEARRALELSNHLSQEQRLLVEGQYQRTVEEWPKAVETYRSLFRLFPDNLDYGILFASAQMHLSAEDSLQTLAALRRLPAPLGDDARIDMTEASAWINRDFTKAAAAAKLAIEKATAQGSPVIVSRTYGILCQQEPSIGASTEAIDICRNALEASIAAKDPNGEAMMRTDLASLYYLRGDITQSAEMLQQAVKKFKQVGNRDGVATALSNFADARLSQGELMEARKLLEESIPEYQAVDDKEGVVLNLDSLGDIWRQNGELDKAEITYQQAETIARKIEDKNAIAYVLSGMGDLALDRGDLTLARKRYEEALALRSQAGEKQSAAESRVSLAKLAIEEGHAADAETVIRKCKEQFHQDQQADDELAASIVLIEGLLSESKLSEALFEAGQAKSLADKSANTLLHLQFEMMFARAEGLAGHFPLASADLERTLKNAHSHQLLGLELETRLAVAELKSRSGQSVAASAESLSLENSARKNGFGLIASKALSFRNARE